MAGSVRSHNLAHKAEVAAACGAYRKHDCLFREAAVDDELEIVISFVP